MEIIVKPRADVEQAIAKLTKDSTLLDLFNSIAPLYHGGFELAEERENYLRYSGKIQGKTPIGMTIVTNGQTSTVRHHKKCSQVWPGDHALYDKFIADVRTAARTLKEKYGLDFEVGGA